MGAREPEHLAEDAEPTPEADESGAVSAHQSSPDRTVFTEDGNRDGWISTDFTVQARR
ncbi:hypothetical protein [Halobaculum sp. P14]|uniref:hypothetical protein n=1 Tax=Halobaculum sp. P14 TaxID=3421638 RepID=UPI003EB99800